MRPRLQLLKNSLRMFLDVVPRNTRNSPLFPGLFTTIWRNSTNGFILIFRRIICHSWIISFKLNESKNNKFLFFHLENGVKDDEIGKTETIGFLSSINADLVCLPEITSWAFRERRRGGRRRSFKLKMKIPLGKMALYCNYIILPRFEYLGEASQNTGKRWFHFPKLKGNNLGFLSSY